MMEIISLENKQEKFKNNKIYQAWINSLPTNALCIGFNILEDGKKEYIFITRNPPGRSQVLANGLIPKKYKLSYTNLNSKYLTDSEEEFALELLKKRGL